MEKENKVYIPKNVRNELQFFRGFGVKELIITIIVGMLSIVPTIFIYKFINQAISLTLFLVTISITIMLISKDDNNVSFIKKLKLVLKNIISQKNFRYK